MKLSIIIPTLNEEDNIGGLLKYLLENAPHENVEIIIVDGGSKDRTQQIVASYPVKFIEAPKTSRASQMNHGASLCSGNYIYYVHADVFPPSSFYSDFLKLASEGILMAMYRQKFNSSNPIFLINSYFTRFNRLWCRGGDQTIFICKKFFDSLNGFDEHWIIMEEYDLIQRAMLLTSLHILPKYALVSARKYKTNSWIRVMLANMKAYQLFLKKVSPLKIKETYQRMLNSY